MQRYDALILDCTMRKIIVTPTLPPPPPLPGTAQDSTFEVDDSNTLSPA